jgi:hypothetical protein
MDAMKIKRPRQRFDMVEVIWNDASELTSGWTDTIDKDEPALALSVGFLVRETKEHIIIAQDIDEEGHHNGRSQIPQGMVKRIKVLKKRDADTSTK